MPSLSEEQRKEAMHLCEEELGAIARQGRAIKPPVPIREWTEEMIRPRVDELEANNRKWRELWDQGLHEHFPLHKPGDILRSIHLDANEYIALKCIEKTRLAAAVRASKHDQSRPLADIPNGQLLESSKFIDCGALESHVRPFFRE